VQGRQAGVESASRIQDELISGKILSKMRKLHAKSKERERIPGVSSNGKPKAALMDKNSEK
jgi:orotate phosphoribosyltransferase-like protein